MDRRRDRVDDGNIAEAGNIREDMFRLLVTADLVIVIFPFTTRRILSARHPSWLRPHGTPLIRADVHSYPFDLQMD